MSKAKLYQVYIKNIFDGADFEDHVYALDKNDAVDHFLKKINYGNFSPWSKEDLAKFVGEVKQEFEASEPTGIAP